jgi:hypothetical protein
MNSIQSFLETARKDPTLDSRIDIEALLETADADFLEGKTLKSMNKDVYDSLTEHSTDVSIQSHFQKLLDYRFVEEIYQIHRGKHVRWIRLSNPSKLMVGGIVVDVRFVDDGVNILCRLPSGRFVQYRFDQCLTYQKLTEDELMILMLNETVET